MKSWVDLEARFRSLTPALRFCRLDAQWGAAGEYWRIAGSAEQLPQQEFELLCGVAGRLLDKVYSPSNEEENAILQIADPAVRWYKLLKERSPTFGNLFYGEQKHADGSSAGLIYSGSISNITDAAANLCLSLQATHPIKEKKNTWEWLHDNYIKAIVVAVIGAVLAFAAKSFIRWLFGLGGGNE